MELRKVMITNNSSVPIDLGKASANMKTMRSGTIDEEILSSSRTWVHGHSKVGSFMISRNYDKFRFRVWGNLIIMERRNADGTEVNFDVLEKK